MWAVGDNQAGQMGDGTYVLRSTPVEVGGIVDAVAIGSGGYHSFAVRSSGTVMAWGRNDFGQLGDGTTAARPSPVPVVGLTGIVSVGGGAWHSLAVSADGPTYTWGYNGWGNLGDGTSAGESQYRALPQRAAIANVLTAAAPNFGPPGDHNIGITPEGQVITWGRGDYSMLGDGGVVSRPYARAVLALGVGSLDLDGDGLDNFTELKLGTDPANADSNGDGISDGASVHSGLSPTNQDMDGDGVPNSVELARGTEVLAAPPPAASDERKVAEKAPEPPKVNVNRTPPAVAPPALRPRLSATPSDEEIFRARVFGEPLVPTGATSPEENSALSAALNEYIDRGAPDRIEPLMSFLERHPQSAWRLSLLTRIGTVLRRTAHYSRAVSMLEEAWAIGRNVTDGRAQAVAVVALAELAELYARLGRVEQLEPLLAEASTRDLHGSVTERLSLARQGLWMMQNRPQESFRCGPLGLRSILVATARGRSTAIVDAAESTSRGTSLSQMAELAERAGLKMQMARRDAGAEFLTPALVHWKAGHFAALVAERDGTYLVQDATFGEELWASREALEDETSGHFLVPAGPLPSGWHAVSAQEGSTIWGKGAPSSQNPQPIKKTSNKVPKRCPPYFMAGYTFHTFLANLNIADIPVSYTPPRGPAVEFEVTYNHRDSFQPQIFTYSNLGPKWTFDWISYVTDDPGLVGQSPAI